MARKASKPFDPLARKASKPFDPLTLVQEVEREDGRRGFEVDPAVIFGASLTAQGLAKNDPDYVLAFTPIEKVNPDDLVRRAELLERLRLWFTKKLHGAIDQAPMALRILKDEGFRLMPCG